MRTDVPQQAAGSPRACLFVAHVVRFIEDHRFVIRNHRAEFLSFKGEVGEEQMVIDDDHVGRHSLASRLHDMAVTELRAFATETVVTRGRDRGLVDVGGDHLRPQRPGDLDQGQADGSAAKDQHRFASGHLAATTRLHADGDRLGERGLAELSPLRYHGGFETKTLVYETLVRHNQRLELEPALAEAFRHAGGRARCHGHRRRDRASPSADTA